MTYKLWDSKYILPLSKDTLDLENIRLNEYEKYPILKNIRQKYRSKNIVQEKKIVRNKRI